MSTTQLPLDVPETPAPPKAPKKRTVKKTDGEKYFWVRFQGKSDPTHKDDVELSVNGETLILQREKKVALPQRFMECADHARYAKFRQLPGENRKVVANILMFPYQTLGEATHEDFIGQKAAGTKVLKEQAAG